MKRAIITVVLPCIMMAGCISSPRFTRTPLDKWKICSFKNVGVRVDLPQKIDSFWIRKHPNELSICMHIVHIGGLTDDQPLVTISIRRLDAKDFDAEREEFRERGLVENGMYVIPKNDDERIEAERVGNALFSFQQSTVLIEGRKGMVFLRRDLRCPDNQVLSARISWLRARYPDGSDHTKEDELAFRRILDSVELY